MSLSRTRMLSIFSISLLAAIALFQTSSARSAEPAAADLPKVVLLGDSIRLSYAPAVAKHLAGKVQIVSPKANGGDSGNLLKHLEEWAIREQPAIVHFNAGIHDTKRTKANGKFQISPEAYEANLRQIVSRLRKETGAVVLFATTTPLVDERAAATRQDRDYELLNKNVEQYNAIALKVMEELKVPVDNLNAVVAQPSGDLATGDLIVADGVHLTSQGQKLVSQAVAEFLKQHLPSAK